MKFRVKRVERVNQHASTLRVTLERVDSDGELVVDGYSSQAFFGKEPIEGEFFELSAIGDQCSDNRINA